VTAHDAEAVAARFIRWLETGEPPAALFTDDAFADVSLPRWRLQAQGPGDILAIRRTSHPWPGKVTRWRCDPTPAGFVLELEEQWQQGGEQWYCRELFRAEVRDGAIAQLAVYCTGDWDSARRAEHAREVRLLRP